MSRCPSCNVEAGDVARFCPSCGASIVRVSQASDDYTGRIIASKFRVEKLIGEGGMGRVYKATQLSLDKAVVLKVLRASLLSDPRTVARFQREAKAASRLNHANSIGVIDFGQSDDGAMYIAMEYVSGRDLHQILSSEGPLAEPRMVRVLGQVLSALADAHAAGVIHRDLKPENIMIEQRRGEPDFVKVLDFGIAKIQESDGEGPALTRAGFVCGTPEYMSPEQARGAQLDARSDLYAVGVILYQCATGGLPFEADSAVGFATMHLTADPIPPRKKRSGVQISDRMERLILRAMAKDPNDRPQSAEEFRHELLELGQDLPTLAAAGAASMTAPIPLRTVSAPQVAGTDATEVGVPGPWSTAPQPRPSQENTASVVTELAPSTASPREAPSTLTIFVGALVATAVVAGGGLFAYDRFLRKSAPLTPPVPVAEAPPAVLPPPVAQPAPRVAPEQPKRDPALARDLARQGDLALAGGRYDEAAVQYAKAYEADPSPAASKRTALGYLMKGETDGAQRWLRQYLKEAPQAPDVPLVERQVRPVP